MTTPISRRRRDNPRRLPSTVPYGDLLAFAASIGLPERAVVRVIDELLDRRRQLPPNDRR